jgi:hypothetical protein
VRDLRALQACSGGVSASNALLVLACLAVAATECEWELLPPQPLTNSRQVATISTPARQAGDRLSLGLDGRPLLPTHRRQ